jgi:hypothetical protein
VGGVGRDGDRYRCSRARSLGSVPLGGSGQLLCPGCCTSGKKMLSVHIGEEVRRRRAGICMWITLRYISHRMQS